MSDDIVTRLRELAIGAIYGINIAPFEHYNAAADEIERLRRERLEWFIVARQLRDAVMAKQEVDEAISDYLRVRGSLEDPRDGMEEVAGE